MASCCDERMDALDAPVGLEEEFWESLEYISTSLGVPMNRLLAHIEQDWRSDCLPSAVRVFVLEYYKESAVIRTSALMTTH